jgi:hypothetical protein
MSSVLRFTSQPKKALSKIFTIDTPCYNDNILNYNTPVPFYVTNQGILEIAIIDNVQTNLLTIGSFAGLGNQPEYQCKIMGGQELVLGLGQTVQDFFKAWINDEEGSVPTELELYVKPVMTKVQFSTNPSQIISETTSGLSDYPPSGSEYVTGEENNVYKTVWVFQSPITVKYYSVANSIYRYATLLTVFDAN